VKIWAFAGFAPPARCSPVIGVFVVNVVFKQQKRENDDSKIGLS
jgi:hypothetical protein